MLELFMGLLLAVVIIPIAFLCGGLWLGMQPQKDYQRVAQKHRS